MTGNIVRHCHICQSVNAYWGFGPPLTRVEVWACAEHLLQTESTLTVKPVKKQIDPPIAEGRLL